MLLIFTCENCHRRFKVDESSQGKRGRCSYCRHVMRIPRADSTEPHRPGTARPAAAAKPAGQGKPAAEAVPEFRLSEPEERPQVPSFVPPPSAVEPAPGHRAPTHYPTFPDDSIADNKVQPQWGDDQSHFELMDDEDNVAESPEVSPAIARGLRELAEFEKDPRGYKIAGDKSGVFDFFGVRDLGPASWLYVKWRAVVNLALKVLRWIDTWAYLISVPFVMLMIFGLVVQNHGLVHTGAVVVFLANYGRFWVDLLTFFVRPYKDGPLHGLLFLFPPYMVYYVVSRWDSMKKIVRRIAMSCIPIVAVVLIYAFVLTGKNNVTDIHDIGGRIEAGKKELEEDIKRDLNQLEKSLIGEGSGAPAAKAPAQDDVPAEPPPQEAPPVESPRKKRQPELPPQ
jgi:hypothetical protein